MTQKQTHEDEIRQLRADVAQLNKVVDSLKQDRASTEQTEHSGRRSHPRRQHRQPVRWDSSAKLFGLPAVSIARGPDKATGQRWGHAIGWVAIGDVATGLIAFGGIARGIVAFGGVAIGVFCTGGLALGLAASVGGIATGYCAVGGIVAGAWIVGGLKIPLTFL